MEVRSWRLEVRSWRLEGGDGAGRSSPPAVDDPMFGPDLQSGPNGQERDFQSRPCPRLWLCAWSGRELVDGRFVPGPWNGLAFRPCCFKPGRFGDFDLLQRLGWCLAERRAHTKVRYISDVPAIFLAVEYVDVVILHQSSSNCRLCSRSGRIADPSRTVNLPALEAVSRAPPGVGVDWVGLSTSLREAVPIRIA